MTLVNRLLTLNLIEFEQVLPTQPADKREQILVIALDEMRAAVEEANDQIIELKIRHSQDESNLVGILKSIQELNKSEANPAQASQLKALQEAKNRLEEDLNGLEYDDRQLRQEIVRLEAKIKAAESRRASWFKPDSVNEAATANQNKKVDPEPTQKTEAHAATTEPEIGEVKDKFGSRRIDEPFARLERLKRKLAANEISVNEATAQLEQEMRNFELEKAFRTDEEEEQLAQDLAELKKNLKK